MTDTPCACSTHEEMELKEIEVKLVQAIVPAVSCDTCRVIIHSEL